MTTNEEILPESSSEPSSSGSRYEAYLDGVLMVHEAIEAAKVALRDDNIHDAKLRVDAALGILLDVATAMEVGIVYP